MTLQKPLDTLRGNNKDSIKWMENWSQTTNSEAKEDGFNTRMRRDKLEDEGQKELGLFGAVGLSELCLSVP